MSFSLWEIGRSQSLNFRWLPWLLLLPFAILKSEATVLLLWKCKLKLEKLSLEQEFSMISAVQTISFTQNVEGRVLPWAPLQSHITSDNRATASQMSGP